MNDEAVSALADRRGSPSVSILCPLDARRPGNDADPLTIAALREQAIERLRTVTDDATASAVVARVDAALSSVDLAHPPLGIAVFVSPDVERVVELDVPVDPEVVVAERFAVGGLLKALSHRECARVLVLSLASTRCVDISGDAVVERRDGGFPVEVEAPVEADTPHGDYPLAEQEHAEAEKFVFRAVDRAVESLQDIDRRPLVLVAAPRELASFVELTRHGADVVASVHGSYEREPADVIAALVRPELDAARLAADRRRCDEVQEAIGTGAVAGVSDAWAAARVGRGHELLLEDGFRTTARRVDDHLVEAAADEPGAFDAVEDTVEEVVRHGGTVRFVPAGSLAEAGRVVLVTRY